MTNGPAGKPKRQNPTRVGETGAEEKVGDKTKGDVELDPSVPMAKPGQKPDADGTLTASAQNDRNEGRGDIAVHHDADGKRTESRDTRRGVKTVPIPHDVDGTVTSNRQTNDADAARRAGFEPDVTDESVAEKATGKVGEVPEDGE